MPDFLPYSRPVVEEDDIEAVVAVLRDDMLTTGPRVAEFEKVFAGATGAVEAVACNSGTAALHLAALAANLGPGQAAIVPAVTFLATANVVRMTGADVVIADVDADTGLMSPGNLKDALARATARGLRVTAALPVHLNGQFCDMPELAAIAERHSALLIEDSCHALGVSDSGANRHSFAACFSTHAVKAVTTAEGGAVTTRDSAVARRMRSLRSHGMIRDPKLFVNRALAFDGEEANPWYYEMSEFGWNYRLPDVLCALGISQLRKLDRFQARRREIAALYDRLLAPLAPALRPVPHGERAHGWHLYAVLVDFEALGTTRRRFMEALRARGIGTQVHYIPLNRQPYYDRQGNGERLPGAEAYYARCLSLPFYPALSDADVERVATDISGLARGKLNAA
jgi:UDP-4-amino-4,6-dideoxy-N-acetyl-beta-L-altrosamine transaminase